MRQQLVVSLLSLLPVCLSVRMQVQVCLCGVFFDEAVVETTGANCRSGLGTFILSQLEDDYPSVLRFTASVFPSEDDDVVTVI